MKHLVLFVCCLFYYIQISTCSSVEELISDDYFGFDTDLLKNDDLEYNNEAQINSLELDEDSMMFLNDQSLKSENEQYSVEKKVGDITDLFGANVHHRQPNVYDDLGRRSMSDSYVHDRGFQKRWNKKDTRTKEDRLTPVKAPPELVLAVARASASLQAAKPNVDTEDIVRKKILRTGDYWDSVWVENVDDPRTTLRKGKNDLRPKLATVRTKIMPGSKLYRLVSVLRQISPHLVYVMNTAKEKQRK